MDSVLDNYVDSGIMYTIDSPNTTFSLSPKLSEKPVRHTPWTAEWMVNALKTDNLSMAVGKLATWFPNNQGKEASEETVLALRKLNKKDALEAMNSFKRKRFVRGTKGKDLKFAAIVESLETG